MRKVFTKIISLTAALVLSLGIVSTAACSTVYRTKPLAGNISGDVSSNGGFAVEKGDYIYYINGKEYYSSDNTYGKVTKGALVRIAKSDLSAGNYQNVQTVVPQIIYSGNYNGGIFIHGDYVYYATPSTAKNSDGEVQSSYLTFKRAKLDGTGVMKDYYLQYSDNTIEYRYVEDGGVVYLLYVAKSEKLYDTEYNNLHAINTSTGKNTLLAYNVGDVTFDSADLANPRVFYTMNVKDYVLNSSFSTYNQVYTVKASATEATDYSSYFANVPDYDKSKDPLYVNCGTLVLDGFGKVEGMTESLTPFNSKELQDGATVDRSAYKYTVSKYENGTLFYTRTSSNYSTEILFAAKESMLLDASWKPALSNPTNEECFLTDGSDAAGYNYIYENGNVTGAIIADSKGLIKATVEGGKLLNVVDNVKTFYLTLDGQATVLFTKKHGDSNYIYYSLSGGNGYTFNRICTDGTYDKYNKLPVEDTVNEYTSVRILDLDAKSDWYKPEMFGEHIIFCSETKHISEFSYMMACDLKGANGVMTNVEIDALNEQYNGIEKAIDEVDEGVYKNLKNAYRYAHFTGDADYIDKLIKQLVAVDKQTEEETWSKASVAKYKDFVAATGDWAGYSATKTVNGESVHANRLSYYYSLLGKMTSEDAEDYSEDLKSEYLKSWPEADTTWFEGLSTGAKVGFLIGVIGGGLIVIGAVVVTVVVVLKKRSKKLPTYTKKRIKVDTTDDKSVDVYSDEESTPPTEE